MLLNQPGKKYTWPIYNIDVLYIYIYARLLADTSTSGAVEEVSEAQINLIINPE